MKQRSRTIHPGFFTNEILAELSYPARILFAGLWTIADREGRLEDRPKKIKIFTLPYEKEHDINELLTELAEARSDEPLIVRYESAGHNYIQITNFTKHQNIHPREADSIIPPPDPEKVSLGAPKANLGKARSQKPVSRSRSNINIKTKIKSGIHAKIIADLNEKSGKHFRPTTASTQKAINGRLAEGYTVDDFKHVHTVKCQDWLGNPDMEKYLNPETLYRPGHFEKYRNQELHAPKQSIREMIKEVCSES